MSNRQLQIGEFIAQIFDREEEIDLAALGESVENLVRDLRVGPTTKIMCERTAGAIGSILARDSTLSIAEIIRTVPSNGSIEFSRRDLKELKRIAVLFIALRKLRDGVE